MAANGSILGVLLLFGVILAILLVLSIAAVQGASIISGTLNHQLRRLGAVNAASIQTPITLMISGSEYPSGSVPLTVGNRDLIVNVVDSQGDLVIHIQAAGAASIGRRITVRNQGSGTLRLRGGRRVIIGSDLAQQDASGSVVVLPGRQITLIGGSTGIADRYLVIVDEAIP